MLKSLWRGLVSRRAVHVPQRYSVHGRRAWERVQELVALGARHPGAEGHRQTQNLIREHLEQLDCDVETVPFVAKTSIGEFELMNIVAKFSSQAGPFTAISGHYDTIRPERVNALGRRAKLWKTWMKLLGKSGSTIPRTDFPGANDGGSSTTLLMELATIVNETPELNDIWIVFFDGEEAFVDWNELDQTYGSRHQAELWKQDGTLSHLSALINIDMIGGADFEALYELNSTEWLRDHVWELAGSLGYGTYFSKQHARKIGDDHLPFVRAGVPALDIIDAEYGPGNGFWHTMEDSPDKLDPQSFAVVLHVLCELLADMPSTPQAVD